MLVSFIVTSILSASTHTCFIVDSSSQSCQVNQSRGASTPQMLPYSQMLRHVSLQKFHGDLIMSMHQAAGSFRKNRCRALLLRHLQPSCYSFKLSKPQKEPHRDSRNKNRFLRCSWFSKSSSVLRVRPPSCCITTQCHLPRRQVQTFT